MIDEFTYDVFLSHSVKDKPTVRAVAERLRADGLRVWLDEWEIKPGDNIPEKIEEGLERSRVLVLCMSAHSFGSEWATLESQTFRFRAPFNKQRRFIPLRFDKSPLKDSLGQFLYIDWLSEKREQAYARLVAACRPSKGLTTTDAMALPKHYAERTIQLDYKAAINTYSFSPDDKYALSGCDDATMRLWDLETGHCIRLFENHESAITSIIWSADGQRALSGGYDTTIRQWEVMSGVQLRTFEGHTLSVQSVALSADGRLALSGSDDTTMRLWDLETGICLQVYEGHMNWVWCVAWSANSGFALSGSRDRTVRLWDVERGNCLYVFEGHAGSIYSVAWSVDGRYALSGSSDATVRLWDIESRRCLRVFEGHTDRVWGVVWSADGRHALSSSNDTTVRLWDVEGGRCLCVLKGHSSPVMTVVWSADGRRARSGDNDGNVHFWDLSEFVVEPPASALASELEQIQYTNAKVLLVGDTGVGKSSLAEQLVNEQFVPMKSSHARKAYVLESQIVRGLEGIALQREIVLWDLAGQPAYRLVHQLSMEDAALACVLFDNRNEINPFEGASYWSQALDQAHTNTRLRKLLVAARIDAGGLPASAARIEEFASKNDFAQFIATSAYSGEGCEELIAAIRKMIPWDKLPRVTTTKTLAALRKYVARLKSERDSQPSRTARLLSVAALHEGFVAYFGEKIALDEFIAYLQRIEAIDEIDLLLFHTTGATPNAETLALLDPTRVDAYASALLVAAKDEPDGPGHLLEARVREGRFTLDQGERIEDPKAEQHVLWYVIERLLERDLALRERIKGQDYLVFPSQCTAELRFPGAAVFGVAFGFAGPVRSIYAAQIAQLAHYEGFKKREFFQDAAAYWSKAGGRCLVRLHDYGRGQGELELSFDRNTPAEVRQGFIEFVGKYLEARSVPNSLTRRHAHYCANGSCRKLFEDRVVKERLEEQRKDLLCPFCEERTPLVDLLAVPTTEAKAVAKQIKVDVGVGRRRMTAGLIIKAKKAEGKFDVFLSYNAKDKPAVERIALRLHEVGLRPWLDKWNLSPGDAISDALERAIKTIPCAALCFGPADIGKWHIIEIRAYLEQWASGDARMIPVILPGVAGTPDLPLFVRQTLWVDMRDWESGESDGFYRLVCGILGKAPGPLQPKRFGARDVAEWQGLNF